jgi:glycosyltransferase involved in cell wall biosynthesis
VLVVPGFAESDADWCIPAVSRLVRAMSTRAEVHVVALRHPRRRAGYEAHGARVVSLGQSASGLGRAAAVARAVMVVRDLRPDIVHALWADEPGIIAVLAGRALGQPVVVSVMGGELVAAPGLAYGGQLSRANRWFLPAALGLADAVTAGSRTLVDSLAARGIRAQRWPLGVAVDMSGARHDPLGGPRPRLVQVGALTAVKDVATSLRALQQLRRTQPSATLHLVGDGPEQARLARSARALGLTESVHFHGQVPHDALGPYYAAADVALVTSRHESQAMVALEAAVHGKLTLGTRVGILPELVPDAWLAAPGDAAGIAIRVGRFLDSGVAASQGRALAERVRQELTIEHSRDALHELYEGLLARP